jgi:hypothetical protein
MTKQQAFFMTMVSYLKKIKIENRKKSCERKWTAALKGHGQSSQSADF